MKVETDKIKMGWRWEKYKPAAAMVTCQCILAAVALLNRAALIHGMKPIIYVVYRQATATLVICPIAFVSSLRRGDSDPSCTTCCMGIRNLLLISACSLFGAMMNQIFYTEGLYHANASVGTSISNLIPAITFLIAFIFRLEKVYLRSMSSIAKITGTVICVGGAISIALLKGPKLLNHGFGSHHDSEWLLGCMFFLGYTCSWSIWLILLVPASKSYPNSLSLATWVCFISTLQAAAVALVWEKFDSISWRIISYLELSAILFSGVAGSGIMLFLQSWCVSKRGPLYSAMFSPLCTVITTIYSSIFLHEQMYIGSLLGSVVVILGLYIVLWGKAQEMEAKVDDEVSKNKGTSAIGDVADDLEQTLLPERSDEEAASNKR